MQTKISKSLEGAIARTAFDTARGGIDHSLKDYLMLAMLRDEETLAYRLLSRLLQDWELYQITLRLEGALREKSSEGVTPEQFFMDYPQHLRQQFDGVAMLSTAHALIEIVDDRATTTSRVLALYRIHGGLLSDELQQLSIERGVGEDMIALPPKSDETHAPPSADASPQTFVERFGLDLTRLAREGALDPVVGREEEIERVVQILSRRRKNNPILVGEAGVGKSAIVEGLAMRIASGAVPPAIAKRRVISLDMASLVAGTKFRGEFEERIQQLVEQIAKQRDTILFIDEVHTIAGAGSTQGGLDTANMLKPALSSGQLQIVGATTLDEYRENIERDAALERRFQRVMVESPTAEQTLTILQRLAPLYATHHGVTFSDEALRACVELSERYISSRQFPDKAVDVLDETGARCSGRSGGVAAEVGVEDVAATISLMTGIPVGRLSEDMVSQLRRLETLLSSRVVGQGEAVASLSRSVRRSRVGLKDERRPIGVFLFVGPTGVGKTLLAKELSQWLTGRDEMLVRFDMSEFAASHNVSRLIGSPPGYVGYGKGGELTEAVRRHPYSVVLLDEIEKAHPDIFNTLLQLLDEGRLTDGSGRVVDFRNTIIIMTSNVGSRSAAQRRMLAGYATATKQASDKSLSEGEYRKALERTFAPEFLNRVDDVIIFRTLEQHDVESIVELEFGLIARRAAKLGYAIQLTEAARSHIATEGYEPKYGARSVKRLLNESVEQPLAAMIVAGELAQGASVVVDVSGAEIGLRVA